MPSFLESLLAKLPGAQDALAKVDSTRAQFLAIPATTQTNRAILTVARSKTNDASEVAALNQLQQQAQTVDSGFQSVLAQFLAFDDLRRSGASALQIGTAAAALAAAARSVQSQSDALTQKVAPIASKYGQPVPNVGGGGGGTTVILVSAALVLFLISQRKRRR